MPYFVYHVKPFGQLKLLSEFAQYAAASAHAKQLRSQLGVPPAERIKVIFAQDALHAEDLLCEVRAAPPLGDD